MQTFTIKVTGDKLTEADIRRYIWQCHDTLSKDDILVEEIV